MLKIKKERLDDLKKFGFKVHGEVGRKYYSKSPNFLVTYTVDAYTRTLSIIFPRKYSEVEELNYELELLYNLIKNDMVELEVADAEN